MLPGSKASWASTALQSNITRRWLYGNPLALDEDTFHSLRETIASLNSEVRAVIVLSIAAASMRAFPQLRRSGRVT